MTALSDVYFETAAARNSLCRAGIRTVDQLCQWSAGELLKLAGFGFAALRDVQHVLESMGRSLRGEGAIQQPRRYGIIPCRRCAFFVQFVSSEPMGQCQRFAPRQNEDGVVWPEVHSGHGCGDGLLREEAAPLPEEPKP